jgi:hypothetical protein
MGNIAAIAKIADNQQKAKEITDKVIQTGDKEGRPFGDILQEEIDKLNKEEATKDTDQSSPR